MANTATAFSTSPPASAATSPNRPSRLRGLSYLRNYTHLHSTPRNPSSPLIRAQSSPNAPTLSSTNGQAPSGQLAASTATAVADWLTQADAAGPTSVRTSDSQALQTSSPGASPATRMTRNRAGTHSGVAPSERNNIDDNIDSAMRSLSTGTEDVGGTAQVDKKAQNPTIRLIPHHEARSSRPSLAFPIMSRSVPSKASIIRVGRYSEKDSASAQVSTDPTSVQPVGFKSKVVSRRHCEFWCDDNQWYVKDVKSSSGTFLNHVRLSPANTESKPYPINDGDIVQLGIDFKGGEEVIFRCVKIRVECNRNWQKSLNQFNTSTHKHLRSLASTSRKASDAGSISSSECSICLNPVAPCQALFVAPCSHVWHYKCIRAIIYPKWPSFQCPNCRAYHDLEADVEPSDQGTEEDDDADLLEATEESRAMAELQRAGDTVADLSQLGISNQSRHEHSAGAGAQGSNPIAIPARHDQPQSATTVGVMSPDGPMTPRNDAGPFVLDTAVIGSGGGRAARATAHARDAAGASGMTE